MARILFSCRMLTPVMLSLAMVSGLQRSVAADRPNIVIIVGDDMGYADVGFHGCKEIPTPSLDSLAAGGVRCSNGYVSGPYCSPTRAGLLTGRYQTRFGHEFNPSGSADRGLPLSETTIADRLKAAGYKTGLVGKWHLGGSAEMHPNARGFDEFFGFIAGAHPYLPGQGAPIYRDHEEVKETEYLTDALGREAVAFIDRHQDEPFFLYLAFNAVHTPMEAQKERLAKFGDIADPKRRKYAAMMSAMDDAIGEVLAKLDADGLSDDTLVFFISDNGGPTMATTATNGSINAPLRGRSGRRSKEACACRSSSNGPANSPRAKFTSSQSFNSTRRGPLSKPPALTPQRITSWKESICCLTFQAQRTARRMKPSSGGSACKWRFARATGSW